MYDIGPFAPPYGSFRVPVVPPDESGDNGPFSVVEVPCSWLPYVRGALKQLLLQGTWDTDDIQTVQYRVFDLIGRFTDCGGGAPFDCTFEMAVSPSGWQPEISDGWSPEYGSVYVNDVGWTGVLQTVPDIELRANTDIHLLFNAPVYISHVTVHFALTKGTADLDNDNSGIITYLDGVESPLYSVDWQSVPDGTDNVWDVGIDPPIAADKLRVIVLSAEANALPVDEGHTEVNSVEVIGFGLSPCET